LLVCVRVLSEAHAQAHALPGRPRADPGVIVEESLFELPRRRLQDGGGRGVAPLVAGGVGEHRVENAPGRVQQLLRGGDVGAFDLDLEVVLQRGFDGFF
jgi:hypothetical protein